jgi:aminobenzoyl-glutamate utilization protein B
MDEILRQKVEADVLGWYERNGETAKKLSKQIWDLAELQFVEYRSSEALIEFLTAAGFTIEKGVAHIPTAFVATYTNGEGPTVGTLGEYDALAGLGCEIADTYRPTGKSGHGCGHNLLGVGGAAACVAAKEAMESLGIHGTVKFFGCPAEEGGNAKVFMVREHVFDGVDGLVSWHPANANVVSLASAMAIMSVRYRFHGRAAHAGVCPHLGRSALDAAILTDVCVNYLREHVPPDVRIQSVISNGGKVPNIVPDEAEIWYYIRAPKRRSLDDVFHRMNKIADGIAMATETTVEKLQGVGACSNGLPNKTLSEMTLANLKRVGGPVFDDEDRAFAEKLNAEVTLEEKRQSMEQMYHITDPAIYSQDLCDTIGDDMMEGVVAPYSGDGSDVAWQTPSVQINTCCQPVGTGNHSWQQVVCSGSAIGQKGMLAASKTIALSLCEALCSPELLKAARAELDAATADYPYVSPLPEGATPEMPD